MFCRRPHSSGKIEGRAKKFPVGRFGWRNRAGFALVWSLTEKYQYKTELMEEQLHSIFLRLMCHLRTTETHLKPRRRLGSGSGTGVEHVVQPRSPVHPRRKRGEPWRFQPTAEPEGQGSSELMPSLVERAHSPVRRREERGHGLQMCQGQKVEGDQRFCGHFKQ
jgi:hypothetical protein